MVGASEATSTSSTRGGAVSALQSPVVSPPASPLVSPGASVATSLEVSFVDESSTTPVSLEESMDGEESPPDDEPSLDELQLLQQAATSAAPPNSRCRTIQLPPRSYCSRW